MELKDLNDNEFQKELELRLLFLREAEASYDEIVTESLRRHRSTATEFIMTDEMLMWMDLS